MTPRHARRAIPRGWEWTEPDTWPRWAMWGAILLLVLLGSWGAF